MEAERRIVVERLTDLGEWEMYCFADELSDEPVCKAAIHVDGVEVEYGVWRHEEGEPSATGKFLWDDAGEWDDAARERVIRHLVGIYEEQMPEVKAGLVFHLGMIDEEPGEDEGDEEDDDDEEDGE